MRDASLRATEEGLVLDADFAFELTPRLAEVVANGVPLYFRVDFELTRRRWYWFDETAASRRLQLRLSYHALSRHYRLSTGLLQQNFADARRSAQRAQARAQLAGRGSHGALADADYEAAVRMRLDTSLLPKPFQLSALTSRELQLESPWKRFTVRPAQTPAPVESREPQEAR